QGRHLEPTGSRWSRSVQRRVRPRRTSTPATRSRNLYAIRHRFREYMAWSRTPQGQTGNTVMTPGRSHKPLLACNGVVEHRIHGVDSTLELADRQTAQRPVWRLDRQQFGGDLHGGHGRDALVAGYLAAASDALHDLVGVMHRVQQRGLFLGRAGQRIFAPEQSD